MINYIKEAADESLKNVENHFKDGGPFGAIIVKDNKIIGRGHNQVLKNNDPTAHAEILAIRDACNNIKSHDLTGCTLYASCYPCPMCLSASIWSNIKEIYYGNTRKDAEEIGFRDDYIYNFIEGNCEDKNVIKLENVGRIETIEVFNMFKKFNIEDDLNY